MIETLDDVIEQIAQSVFATMLNIDVMRDPAPEESAAEFLLAAVHISGAWTGTVVVGMSAEVAEVSAAEMMRMPLAEVADIDRRETASELTNMIGGNLKSLLPAPSFLSLPMIVSGSDFGVQIRDAELVDRVPLVCQAGHLNVRLYRQLSKP